MMDEGVIKYSYKWFQNEAIEEKQISSLMQWRDYLYQLGLIGVYDNGIGFGNISIRIGQSNQFIISGTQTGHIPKLGTEHYTVVTEFNIEQNYLTCCGPISASSESLTHAAIYSYQPQVNAIIHVHNHEFWQNLIYQVPTTLPAIPYGTPLMAKEMFRLFDEENLGERKILVMAGHEDGLLTFGENLAEAGEILDYFTQRL